MTAAAKSAAIENLWITLGIDPVSERLVMLGFADNATTAVRNLRRRPADEGDDVLYRKNFRFAAPDLSERLFAWFRSCGIVTDNARQLVRDLGNSLMAVVDHVERGGKCG